MTLAQERLALGAGHHVSIGVQGKARDHHSIADRLKLTASASPLQQLHRREAAIAEQRPERPFPIKPHLHDLTGWGICRANALPARTVECPQATRRRCPDGFIWTASKVAHGSR